MNTQNIAIAYCIDNINVAESLDQQLSPALGDLIHLYGSRTNADKLLTEQVLKHKGPILLLISDNYLKSTACMLGGLHMLNERQDQILPIVIDGVRKENDDPILVPTQFDRISDMIQYINYWQDQYLDLRRQKRELSDLDEAAFNEHLKSIREISSETSEFLRVLRNITHYSLEEFSHNDFQVLFQFIGDQHAWESFQKNRLHYRMQQQAGNAAGGDHAEVDVMERNDGNYTEMPDIAINDIPGMDLLDKAEQAEEEGMANEHAPLYSHSKIELEINQAEEEEEEGEEVYANDLSDEYHAPEVEAAFEAILEETIEEEEEEGIEDTLEEEEQEEPLSIETIIESAWTLAEGGRSEEALEQLRDANESYDTPVIDYYQSLILAQFDQNLPAAKALLVAAAQKTPVHEDSLFLLGEVSEIEEDFAMAATAYEKLYQLNPAFPKLKYRLGVVWAHHFDEKAVPAAALLAEAVTEEPENADAFYQYSLLLSEKLKQPETAIPYLQKTLSLSPDHPFAHYDLALIYHRQGNAVAAAKSYEMATQINPELKTIENDMAFNLTAVAHDTTAIEQTTLEALKENISRLENLINAREEENLKLKKNRPGNGKTVFISGATSGIGKATAEIFAANGFRLILNGRREDRLDELKTTFEKEHQIAVKLLPFDITQSSDLTKAVESLGEEWQNVDILINNAGKAKGHAPIQEGELSHWEEMVDTNLKGVLHLTRAISPQMVKRNSGHIINVGSADGRDAIDGLTKAMRMDLSKNHIRVSQISPAQVEETGFATDGGEEKAMTQEGFQALSATDVAEAIYFMATRPAHVNVQTLLMMNT
ncbi:MAG: SDR family NAD(P)-dependent oxidoreductase [Saprospiraceae bacterium]